MPVRKLYKTIKMKQQIAFTTNNCFMKKVILAHQSSKRRMIDKKTKLSIKMTVTNKQIIYCKGSVFTVGSGSFIQRRLQVMSIEVNPHITTLPNGTDKNCHTKGSILS